MNDQLLSAVCDKSVGVGILSWKSDETLRATLTSHAEKGLFELFDASLIHFQEVRPQDEEIAKEFQIHWVGSETNRHIGGGFYKLIQNLHTDYVFLLEDDLVLDKGIDDLKTALIDGLHLLTQGDLDLFQCRRRGNLQRTYTKYWRIHDFDSRYNESGVKRFYQVSAIRRGLNRLRRPFHAERMLSKAPWVERYPEKVYPGSVRRIPSVHGDVFVLVGKATKWSNPAILAHKKFLLEVYDYIRDQTPGFEDFGLSLEKLINTQHREWWLKQGYRIGTTKPILIDHARHADGGKLTEGYVRMT